MPDREKAIRILEGNYKNFVLRHNGELFTINELIALLKAQEPRVLALDEIHRGMAVWLEDVDKADVILAIGGSSAGGAKCFITENDTSITPLSAEYGIRWRAWTAEPNDEQREAVKWDK